MKKSLYGFLAGLSVMGLLAMNPMLNEDAKAEQVQGLFIFVKSKPTSEYEVLGTIKGPMVGSHEFDDLLNSLLKKAKKDYPQASGLLFDGAIKQTHNTTVSVIKFK